VYLLSGRGGDGKDHEGGGNAFLLEQVKKHNLTAGRFRRGGDAESLYRHKEGVGRPKDNGTQPVSGRGNDGIEERGKFDRRSLTEGVPVPFHK